MIEYKRVSSMDIFVEEEDESIAKIKTRFNEFLL